MFLTKKQNNKYISMLPWILFAIALTIIIFLIINPKDPQDAVQKEAQKIIQAVGRLVVLPTNEVPTIATVTDKEKLKDMEFFKDASIGDKVLIYQQAKKAILYSPKLDKIIEIAPFDLGSSSVAR